MAEILRHSGRRPGFSLIELLIALGISVFIFFIMGAVLVPGIKACRATTFSLDMTQNVRVGLERMVREIRAAPEIATELPDEPGDPELPVSHDIIFEDPRSEILQYVRYYQSGDELHRVIYTYYLPGVTEYSSAFDDFDELDQPAVAVPSDDRVIARYVDSVEFWGHDPVRILITYDYHGNRITWRASARLRNTPAAE